MAAAYWYRYVINTAGTYSIYQESADSSVLSDSYIVGYVVPGDTKLKNNGAGGLTPTYTRIFSDDDSGGNQKPAVNLTVSDTTITPEANIYSKAIPNPGYPFTIYLMTAQYADGPRLDSDSIIETKDLASRATQPVALTTKIIKSDSNNPVKTLKTYKQMIDSDVNTSLNAVSNALKTNPDMTVDQMKAIITQTNGNTVSVNKADDKVSIKGSYYKTNYNNQQDYDNEPNYWLEATTTVSFGAALTLTGYSLGLSCANSTTPSRNFKAHVEVYKSSNPNLKAGFDLVYTGGINRSSNQSGLAFGLLGTISSNILKTGDVLSNTLSALNLTGYVGDLVVKVRYDSRDTTLDSIVWQDNPLGTFKRSIKLSTLTKTKYNR